MSQNLSMLSMKKSAVLLEFRIIIGNICCKEGPVNENNEYQDIQCFYL